MAASIICHGRSKLNLFIGGNRKLNALTLNSSQLYHSPKSKIFVTTQSRLYNGSSTSFFDLHELRRSQARRSILVNFPKEQKNQLLNICSDYGQLDTVNYFQRANRHYALIEFNNESSLSRLANDTKHYGKDRRLAVPTRFISLLGQTQIGRGGGAPKRTSNILHTERPFNESALNDKLSNASNVSDQIKLVHRHLAMNGFAERLRFFFCMAVEDTLRGLFPYMAVRPFGSSVNGFGRYDCDLDMNLNLDEERNNNDHSPSQNGLYFMTKLRMENRRQDIQQCLQTMSGILQNFIPQFFNVRRILRARVPIIKFEHSGTLMEFDLTIDNMSGVYMSELLHLLGELDSRVRPLVFTIKHWSRCNMLNTSHPGPWLTSFHFTWLVICYLQMRPTPVLPPISRLKAMAGPSDRKIAEDNLDCSFISQPRKIKQSSNKESLDELLQGFFDFYAKFDFENKGLSAVLGGTFPKSDEVCFHLENPLETNLNAGQNVNKTWLSKFQELCKTSMETLQAKNDSGHMDGNGRWGLAAIIPDPPSSEKSEELVKTHYEQLAQEVNIAKEAGTGDENEVKDNFAKETKNEVDSSKDKNKMLNDEPVEISSQSSDFVQKANAELISQKSAT